MSSNKLALMRVAVGTVLTAMVVTALLGEIPTHALAPSVAHRQQLIAVFPQGWAFFTRNPQEAQTRVYLADGAGWTRADMRSGYWRFLLGFRRTARFKSVELSAILKDIPKSAWVKCEVGALVCAGQGVQAVDVENKKPANRYFCSRMLIDERAPVPWAWSGLPKRVEMPGRIALVNVQCGQPASTTPTS